MPLDQHTKRVLSNILKKIHHIFVLGLGKLKYIFWEIQEYVLGPEKNQVVARQLDSPTTDNLRKEVINEERLR
jgi:hypothetical protein